MINSELLKSAIADAKAVRATALANAKASLEEAFAPRFEAMFAEKLKGESEEDEEMIAEVEAPNQVSGKGGEAKGPATKPVTKGQPKKVSDANTNWKVVAAGGSEAAKGSSAPASSPSIMKEVEEEEGKLDEAGLTSEDLDEIISELEAEVSQDEVPAPQTGEEIPGEEGQEQGQLPQPPEGMNAGLPPAPEAPVEQPIDGQEEMPVAQAPAPQIPPVGQPQAPGAENGEEEINLDELLAALNEESEEDEGKVSEGKLPPWLKKKGEKKDGEKEEKEEELDEIANNGLPKAEKGQDAAYKNTSTSSKNHGGDIGSGPGPGPPLPGPGPGSPSAGRPWRRGCAAR